MCVSMTSDLTHRWWLGPRSCWVCSARLGLWWTQRRAVWSVKWLRAKILEKLTWDHKLYFASRSVVCLDQILDLLVSTNKQHNFFLSRFPSSCVLCHHRLKEQVCQFISFKENLMMLLAFLLRVDVLSAKRVQRVPAKKWCAHSF